MIFTHVLNWKETYLLGVHIWTVENATAILNVYYLDLYDIVNALKRNL